MAEILRQFFLNLHPEAANISAMHRDGAIVLRKTLLQLVKILFDSGEIHASYIDPKLVARYRTMFDPFIRPIQKSVTLGDARTTHSVFEMGSHIIIGLPDIARTFGTLFIKMIQKVMDSPISLRRSGARPSVQEVINHSYWSNQSLLMLSNSESESDEEFLSWIRLIDRCSDSSDDDSGPIDDIAYESYDDGSDNVTIPDPVDSDLWIEQ